MKRVLLWAGLLYLHLALVGRFVEAMGAVRCECAATCWCHRPVLSLFRWVFPIAHTAPPPRVAESTAGTG